MTESESKYSCMKWIAIAGLRGFSKSEKIEFGLPNGQTGSGLTIIVGPNNSGKTTIIEALNALSKNKISISEEKRNLLARGRFSVSYEDTNGNIAGIKTVEQGGSEIEWDNELKSRPSNLSIFVLFSKKTFNPFFMKDFAERPYYIDNFGFAAQRQNINSDFFRRLFTINENKLIKDNFNSVLGEILVPLPEWTIDLYADGNYYLKFQFDNYSHSSDGVGEGIVSIFMIVDALYDSQENQIVVLDEPELSLHPILQKRLIKLLGNYAAKRQIIIATHSPKFIDWKFIFNGAKIIRTVNEPNGIKTYSLTPELIDHIKGLVDDTHFPHTLGDTAKEAFFQEDKIVLVEGQEDIVYYAKILDQLRLKISGEFFGWGVGGARKMRKVSAILSALGYKKICGLLDQGKGAEEELDSMKNQFPMYKYKIIPAQDVRTKNVKQDGKEAYGLLDETGQVRSELRGKVEEIFADINSYFELRI